MVKLHLKNTEEFEDLFRNKTITVTEHIVEGISNAMQDNKKSADLSPVNTRPVRLPPCAAGAKPRIRRLEFGSP